MFLIPINISNFGFRSIKIFNKFWFFRYFLSWFFVHIFQSNHVNHLKKKNKKIVVMFITLQKSLLKMLIFFNNG
jgi:hypothetical protein